MAYRYRSGPVRTGRAHSSNPRMEKPTMATKTSANINTNTNTASAQDPVKGAFAPVTDALKNLPNLEVPEAAREFFRKTAGTAKERAADLHAGSEKVTAAIETAVAGSVSEVAKISRNIQQAIYQDAEAFFAGIDKLVSATSVNEAVQIQSDMVRARGEVLMARAKSTAEYVGKLVTDG